MFQTKSYNVVAVVVHDSIEMRRQRKDNDSKMKSTISVMILLLIGLADIIGLVFVEALSSVKVSDKFKKRPTVLITGSTDGIGVTTAKHMASKGYNIFIHGRDEKRIQQSVNVVKAYVEENTNFGNNDDENDNVLIIPTPPCDISTVTECKKLVSFIETTCNENDLKLSVLMNNAGVYSERLVLTSEGLEETFAVNVLAPFVITSHLLPLLLKSEKSRIVIASSISQGRNVRDWDDLLKYNRRSYSAHGAYSDSKLLDAMLTFEFAKRLQDAGYGTDRITCNCLDPGTVNTKMLLAGWGPCGIDVEDALDQTWLCTDDEVENISGRYFIWKSERRASGSAYEQSERDKMWSILSTLAPDSAKQWEFSQ